MDLDWTTLLHIVHISLSYLAWQQPRTSTFWGDSFCADLVRHFADGYFLRVASNTDPADSHCFRYVLLYAIHTHSLIILLGDLPFQMDFPVQILSNIDGLGPQEQTTCIYYRQSCCGNDKQSFFLKQLLVERVNDLLASFFHLKGRHVP